MNRYETSIPRAALAIAAVAMTAITIGLTVVVPARMGAGSQEAPMLAGPPADTLPTAAAVSNPPRVDVDANREPKLDSVEVQNRHTKRKQQS